MTCKISHSFLLALFTELQLSIRCVSLGSLARESITVSHRTLHGIVLPIGKFTVQGE